MIKFLMSKIVGSRNERVVRRLRPLVDRINEFEKHYQSLNDAGLQGKTAEFRSRIEKEKIERGVPKLQEEARGLPREQAREVRKRVHEIEQEILEGILPEAFAAVKNSCRRLCGQEITVRGHPLKWDMVPFDVQLIGGIVLHRGNISEMATGEGKTLVAVAPLYLNALTGKNVHLVTVNDYLAARDSEWMGAVYKFLGLTVGCIEHDQDPDLRRAQYACDITYGTNSEFGFDYLRDNGMATSREGQVQRGHYFAIVDEVDSILIDEARTPLIISGAAAFSSHQYDKLKPLIDELVRKQTLLCNRLVNEARQALETGDSGVAADNQNGEIGRTLLKVRYGMPKNKQLLKLMEEAKARTLQDKAELELLTDTQKIELHRLKEELFFVIDEKSHEADLTEKGRQFMNPSDPNAFVMFDLATAYAELDRDSSLSTEDRNRRKAEMQQQADTRGETLHNISQLLRAYCLYEKDVNYVVQENQVIIVDEFTGRLMTGRRWSDGLHQAVEAKEGVTIERETQTYATITIQNYFRLYAKLSGMTGTAETEAQEFKDIYKLDCVVIPTNKPNVRKDFNDLVYKTRREKYNAVIKEIAERHAQGQPLLVGTASVESSEVLARMLKREKIPHAVLNAKFHQQEAEIVSRAGQRGAVTIATNMAGRGTDIKLSADVIRCAGDAKPDVYCVNCPHAPRGAKRSEEALCGLMVIGTERHEARRIDRQLRGRCARQGDPGASRFYVSFEDDLMRLFGSDRITKMMDRMSGLVGKLEEGEALDHPLLNRSIETAQKRVEQRNFGQRKRTLEFDDVMNNQREVVYGYRNDILQTDKPREVLFEIVEDAVADRVEQYLAGEKKEEWDVEALVRWVNVTFPISFRSEMIPAESQTPEDVGRFVLQKVEDAYKIKEATELPDALKMIERHIVLIALDRLWQEHLYNMDSLRDSIQLRAYGQKDPLVEYRVESHTLFAEMMRAFHGDVASHLFRYATRAEAHEQFMANLWKMGKFSNPEEALSGSMSTTDPSAPAPKSGAASSGGASDAVKDAIKAMPVRREGPRVKPNDPCPCQSGKKYKKCCGA